uniref:MCM N-terminal domain-containing protein n=1 Tax=Oryza meridionalis TaxID=40149 RepID=A0A0E0DQ10_9ORYZ
MEGRFACEVESQPDMSEPGNAPPLMPDQGSQIEERFLAFLKGYEVNGHKLYKTIHKALATINFGDMSINYKHLQQFDPILANTIHIFFGSVQTNLANAAKVFLKEEVGFQCENLLVKICDRPMPRSFMPLKDFWSLPEHHPSEECDIYCGETSLRITKTTPDGRIILLNLLKKIFGSFEKGNSWNGDWTIADVMVCLETYEVEIIKPFCKKCNYATMRHDILVVSTSIIPEFKCGGRFPAFFGHLDCSLRNFIIESSHCRYMEEIP